VFKPFCLTLIILTFCQIQVNVVLKKSGVKVEHQGIKIEFVGQIGELILSSGVLIKFVYVVTDIIGLRLTAGRQ